MPGTISYNAQSNTYNGEVTTHVMTVSGNGQVSIPAGARARWKTRKVIVVDLGDRVVMRPAPDEPVEKLEGKYRMRGPSSDQARRQARLDDAARAGAR
jgi:bifunctional DNA-binding transcriptional regulator/antitoxin component of YhaV-PrlF toxin-antitoxin module